MSISLSVYLDTIRILAAIAVFYGHLSSKSLFDSTIPAVDLGHSSVVVFFVLSGFVIAYVSETKETDWKIFISSRIARVLSVTVPALLITPILGAIGRNIYPEIYEGYPFDNIPLRFITSLFFLNEIWTISVTYLSNTPYWSICYEVWYYVIFGLIFFIPTKNGIFLSILLSLAIGPKIILLAPIWWLGVLAYRINLTKNFSKTQSAALFIFSIGLAIAFNSLKINSDLNKITTIFFGTNLHQTLTFSKNFLSDYVLGFIVFINFISAKNLFSFDIKSNIIVSIVRTLANITFPLYLLHQPISHFLVAITYSIPRNIYYVFFIFTLTMLLILIIGPGVDELKIKLRSISIKILLKHFPVFKPTIDSKQ